MNKWIRTRADEEDWWGEDYGKTPDIGTVVQLNEEDMRGYQRPLPRLGFAPQGGRPGDQRPARKKRRK